MLLVCFRSILVFFSLMIFLSTNPLISPKGQTDIGKIAVFHAEAVVEDEPGTPDFFYSAENVWTFIVGTRGDFFHVFVDISLWCLWSFHRPIFMSKSQQTRTDLLTR